MGIFCCIYRLFTAIFDHHAFDLNKLEILVRTLLINSISLHALLGFNSFSLHELGQILLINSLHALLGVNSIFLHVLLGMSMFAFFF